MMGKQQLKLTSQRGAALLVALVIMALVSVLGLSALRSSLFSGKNATVAQADAMAFEAAETALRVTYNELSSMNGETLFLRLHNGQFNYCITGNEVKNNICSDTDFMDERKLLVANSASMLTGYTPREGFQVSQTGGGGIYVDYNIDIYSKGDMQALDITDYHKQEAVKFGVLPASEITIEGD